MESGINFTSNLGSNPGIELDTPRFKVYSFGGRVTSGGGKFEADNCMYNTIKNSLFNSASLVITPNSTQEGKLYSVIPSDGSGDLSVTRATTATRVNSAGLVELVPYNLLQYSEQFNNAVWATYAAGTGVAPIITANSTTAPNGTLTADKVVLNAGASATPSDQSQLYQLYAVTSGKTYTLSFYAKGENGGEQIMVRHAGAGSYTKITLTNQWARYTLTETAPLDISVSVVFLIRRGLLEPINASATFYLWGAQLVEGSTAKDYQKTETRLNIPRLDYSNGTCPSILLEPQRTNLNLYSEQLNNAAYNTGGGAGASVVVSANYGIAPDGNQTADRLQITRGTTYVERYQRRTTTIGQTYTLSFWGKAVTGTPTLYTCYNLGYEGPVTFTNEWVRYTYTFTALYSDSGFNLITWTNLAGTSASADILVWGAQLEAGSYATSYIPTTSASVTRNADVISKTGISSLIGQTEGTIFAEFIHNGANITTTQSYFTISSGNNNNIITIGTYTNRINPTVRASNVSIFDVFAGPNPLTEGVHKIAIGYKSGDFAIYLDGASILTSAASATFGTMGQLDLGNSLSNNWQLGDGIKATALWKTRLTNDQLATLTTL